MFASFLLRKKKAGDFVVDFNTEAAYSNGGNANDAQAQAISSASFQTHGHKTHRISNRVVKTRKMLGNTPVGVKTLAVYPRSGSRDWRW